MFLMSLPLYCRNSNYAAENKQLLDEIEKYCQRSDYKPERNILLMGKCGAGKSALVNTITKALVGENFDYHQRAKVGGGETSKTLEFTWYKYCGVTEDDIGQLNSLHPLRPCYKALPTIIDSAGASENNIESFSEILTLMIKGFIPPNTSITDLEEIQEAHGVGKLSRLYKRHHPEWSVSNVVYVQSGQSTVPKKLVEQLLSILRSSGLDQCDLFVIVTRLDLVSEEGSEHEDEDVSGIPGAKFEEVVDTAAKYFNIKGALGNNLIRWESYSDASGFSTNAKIDNIALRFVKEMVKPTSVVKYRHQIPWFDRVQFWVELQLEKTWKYLKRHVDNWLEQVPDANFREMGVDPDTGRKWMAYCIMGLIVGFPLFLWNVLFLR